MRTSVLATILTVLCGVPAAARTLTPIEIPALPHIVIFSPEFYWSNTPDTVRMASATCPKGRAIGGGLRIRQGSAPLRIQDSYPDGASWVVRFAVQRRSGAAPPAETLRVRGFAICLLPVSRDFSVPLLEYPRLLHQSHEITIPAGGAGESARQACPEGTLVISGGIGAASETAITTRLRLELSYPDPHGWNVRAANDAAAGEAPAALRVHGVCIGKTEGLDISNHRTLSFVETDVRLRPDGTTLRQAVVCPDTEAYALAGGFRVMQGKNATVELRESFPDAPSSWTIAVSNRAAKDAGSAAVRLYAVCLRK